MAAATTTIRTATTAWARFHITDDTYATTVTHALTGHTLSTRTAQTLRKQIAATAEDLLLAALRWGDTEMAALSHSIHTARETALDAIRNATAPEQF